VAAPVPTTTPPQEYGHPARGEHPERAGAARDGGARRPRLGSRRRAWLVLPVLLLLVAVALAAWQLFLRPPALPPGVIAVSGRIEGDDAAVAAKTSGRIREVRVREGDRVEAGQVLAVLDDAQVRAREEQAEAAVRQAEARVRLARHQITVLEETLRQHELAVEQARLDARGRVDEAEARLAAAEAQLAQAEAAHAQARWDRDAFTRLLQTGAVAEQEARRAQHNEQAQAAVVAATRRQVEAARAALVTARASLANPAIRSAQVGAVQGQILQAQADVAAAQADAARARAQLEEARANRADLAVVAPFAGTVATRTAEPGEVVAAGTPVVTVVNLADVYLRAFVPEGDIGRVRVGQPARVYLDSAPATPIEAAVSRIDPEASFTPENTYFREDRVKQVFGVKLQLRGAVGFAKPGMPADGEVLVEGREWPAGPTRR
jgi:HlyD family secretion protein